jgi:fatty-acid desaturase
MAKKLNPVPLNIWISIVIFLLIMVFLILGEYIPSPSIWLVPFILVLVILGIVSTVITIKTMYHEITAKKPLSLQRRVANFLCLAFNQVPIIWLVSSISLIVWIL